MTYRFGDFFLDAENHRLLRADEVLILPPKAFQLLVLLVENGGRLLTKEELLDQLWPDVTVQENNLTQQISVLRKTLGEGIGIETLPRVGYRFTTEVDRVNDADVPAPPRIPRTRRAYAAAFSVAVIAILVIAFMRREASAAKPEIRTLAILPLRSLGNSTGTEHLGLGIADAIIYQIAALQSIEVRPTSAVRRYAGGYDLVRAARELSVDAVVEGTIQREGDRIRIRVQLVDVRKNKPVYSGKFDEPAADLFAVEDVVAGAVARALSLETSGGDRKRRSVEPGAYEAYLKGRFEWSRRTPPGIEASIVHYRDAITRDPSYAAAWAALAESLNLLSMHRLALPDDSFPRAKEAAAKALSIDNSNADAHVALGIAAFYYDWDWIAAEKHLHRAIALDPQQSSARHILANVMTASGRTDEAAQIMAEAMRRDPLSVALISIAGLQHFMGRRHEEGIRLARRAIDRDSSFATAYGNLAINLTALGRHDEAVLAAQRKAQLIGMDSYAAAELAATYAYHPKRRADALAARTRLLDLHRQGRVSPYDLARYFGALGEKRETLHWLEETRKQRDPGMVWLAVDPRFDSLRDEPRFERLLETMKLTAVRPETSPTAGR